MVENNKLETALKGFLGTRSGRTTGEAVLNSIINLASRGQTVSSKEEHPLFCLAQSVTHWRVSCMEHVCNLYGMDRKEWKACPYAATDALLKMIVDPTTISLADVVQRHWDMVMIGRVALPVMDSVIKPHQALRDVVSDRKGEARYRSTFALPGVYTGQCACCNTHRVLQVSQLLGSIPSVKDGEQVLVNKLRKEMKPRGDNFGILSSTIIDFVNDDRNLALMDLLMGAVPQVAVIQPILTERRDSKTGKLTFDLKFACANCLHNLGSPEVLVSSAHATKATADLYYNLTKDLGVKGALNVKKEITELQRTAKLARSHLKGIKKGSGNVRPHANKVFGPAKLSPMEEDALCRELISAGFKDKVRPSRGKTHRRSLTNDARNEGVQSLKNLLSNAETIAAVNLSSGTNIFGSFAQREAQLRIVDGEEE